MEINKLYLGDCLEVMKTFPDKSIELIICDVPYGMEYQSARRTDSPQFDKIQNDNNIDWFKPFIEKCYKILKDNTHIYIFCNDYSISDFRKEMELAGFNVKRTLVWVKNNHTSGDLEGDYGNKTEFILYAQKGRRFLNGNRDTNVLNFDRVSSLEHPTQKPINLLQYLIEKSSNENDLVLDPMCGSGSTCVASFNAKRKFIGIEINEKYYEIAKKRLYGELFL